VPRFTRAMGLLLWPNRAGPSFLRRQNRLRQNVKIASRNGFVSGVLQYREMNRSIFGRQAPV